MNTTFEEIKNVCEVGYTAHSGIEITGIGEGYAEGHVRIRDEQRNPYGAVHGGLIFSLGDVLGGVAFRTLGGYPVTLSSSITYFRPMPNDREISARADVVKYGKTTGFVEIRIFNEQQIECARIDATYYNVEGRVKL